MEEKQSLILWYNCILYEERDGTYSISEADWGGSRSIYTSEWSVIFRVVHSNIESLNLAIQLITMHAYQIMYDYHRSRPRPSAYESALYRERRWKDCAFYDRLKSLVIFDEYSEELRRAYMEIMCSIDYVLRELGKLEL